MNHQHFSNQISDYLLDLLPTAERQALEGHLAGCAHCRQAVLTQQQLVQTIRGTLVVATRPGPGRIAQLMPHPPIHRRPSLKLMRRPLAAMVLLVVLGLAGLNWQMGYNQWRNPAVTVLAVTATHQPTSTATHTAGHEQNSPIEPAMTPRPAGTPIADLNAN